METDKKLAADLGLAPRLLVRVCNVTIKGPNKIQQHLWTCKTCNMTAPEKGICRTCSEICHSKHELVYFGVGRQTICQCGLNKNPNGMNCLSTNPFVYDTDSCTYSIFKEKYQNQDIYTCKTCELTGKEGICWVCNVVCHSGHDTVLQETNKNAVCHCKKKEKPGTIACYAVTPRHFRLTFDMKKLAVDKAAKREIYSVRCPILLSLDTHLYW